MVISQYFKITSILTVPIIPQQCLAIKRDIDTRVMRHFYITYMLEVDVDKFDVKTAVRHTTFKMNREVTEDTNNRLREGASKLLDLIYPKKEKSNIIQFPTMA